MKNHLELKFLALGIACPIDLLVACSDISIAITGYLNSGCVITAQTPLPESPLLDPTEPGHFQRMAEYCQKVLGVTPSGSPLDLETANLNLVAKASDALATVTCSCAQKNDISTGWILSPAAACKKHQLWFSIGRGLDYTVCSFSIQADPNTTVRVPHMSSPMISSLIEQVLRWKARVRTPKLLLDCETFYSKMYDLFSNSSVNLASSSVMNTIFPTTLRDFQISEWQSFTFELAEGQLMFKGRYYRSLKGHYESSRRLLGRENFDSLSDEVVPSSSGEHSNLDITICERLDHLEMRATARVSGQDVHLDLQSVIITSLGLQETKPCEHPVKTPLKPGSSHSVITTTVASPFTFIDKIAIAQTLHNPVARLLCCDTGMLAFLLKDCCLNCALRQMSERNYKPTGEQLNRMVKDYQFVNRIIIV